MKATVLVLSRRALLLNRHPTKHRWLQFQYRAISLEQSQGFSGRPILPLARLTEFSRSKDEEAAGSIRSCLKFLSEM
jgi:hypothetical protein